MMFCHILEHTVQQSYFQRAMIRNADVMLAATLSSHLNVRTSLP